MKPQPTHPPHRSEAAHAVRRRTGLWIAGSAVGGTVVALPDSGPRIISFSDTHGPSAIDLIGVVVLIVAWLPVAWLLWSERGSIIGRSATLAGVLAIVGVVTLAITVGLDLGPSWMAAVAVLLTAQIVALLSVARSGQGRRSPPD